MAATKHNNVSSMVRALSETSFADDFDKRLSGRQLVKTLTVLRNRAGLSQKEIAEKLGCTQGKISKLENGEDDDLSFGDFVKYSKATGHGLRLHLVPQGSKLVDDVKMHAFAIKRLLDRMVALAGDDAAMTHGCAKFLLEAAQNLNRFIASAAESLPKMSNEEMRSVQVEVPEEEEEESPADADSAVGTGR